MYIHILDNYIIPKLIFALLSLYTLNFFCFFCIIYFII
nr:MAG TPA: hypothetical protein [Caudoviricetes sp.]